MKAVFNLFRLTIISSGRWLAMVLITHLLIGGLFQIKYFQWHVYMMYGYILIAFLTSFYYYREFKPGNKYFLYSLPLKRETIVYFRYLIAFILFTVCLGLWFLNGYLFDMFWLEHTTYFHEIFYPKVVFIALLFFIIQQSLFLPTAFKLKMTGNVISFVFTLSVAVASVPVIFQPYAYSYSRYFHQQDVGLIGLLSVLLLVLVAASIYTAIYLNDKRDI